MKKQDSPALRLEKQTLTAWAQILYRSGMIDAARAHDHADRADDGEQDRAGGRTALTGFCNICHTDHKNCMKKVLRFQIRYVILLS